MARSSRALPVAGYVLAVVGLVLLIWQVINAVRGSVLSTVDLVLLWVGVGFIAIAIALLTAAILSGSEGSAGPAGSAGSAGGGEPADG